MIEEEKISVIVPVYNVEKYLEKCLKTILNQTYKNLQIIVIDDGSTDKSSQICDDFSRQDERISVIHKKNGGLSAARNDGLDLVQGKYVIFIDSDDYISDNMVELLYKGISENEADYCVCGFTTVTDTYDKIKEYKPKEKILSGKDALRMHYFAKEYSVNFVMACAKIYKSELWKTLRFVEKIYFEDVEIMPRVLLNSNKVVIINHPGYYYVQQEGSIMHNPKLREKMYKDSMDIFESHIDLYSREGILELRNAEIQLLLDKIITHDLHDSIPYEAVTYSKKLYNKYFMQILATKMSLKKYVRYWVYRVLGKKGYILLKKF